MQLGDYVAIIRRWWWLLVASIPMGAAAAYGVSSLMTPTYEATAMLLVAQRNDTGVIQVNDLEASDRLARTFSQLILLTPVLVETSARLNQDVSVGYLASALSVSNPAGTALLRVTATDPEPDLAQRMANTVAEVFIASNEASISSRPGTVSIVEPAQSPAYPSSPQTKLNVMVGAFVALLTALGAIAVLEYLDDTVKNPAEIARLAGIPTLGQVGRFRASGDPAEQLMIASEPQSHVAEHYRGLRTAVSYALTLDQGDQAILITSPDAGDGKSTTVGNLAIAFGAAGSSVVVVDADLRQPMQHELFRVGNTAGLTSMLLRDSEDVIQRLVRPTAYPNVSVIPSGPVPPNPSELLGSERMRAVMETLRGRFDIILIDAPPVLAATDASVLAWFADASVIVISAGRTRSPDFQNAVQLLARAGKPIAGAVLNRVNAKAIKYGALGSNYGRKRGAAAYGSRPSHGLEGAGESESAHSST